MSGLSKRSFWKTVFFVPCRKQVVLMKIGENSDIAFCPQSQRILLLGPRKSTKMTIMAAATRAKWPFAKKHRFDNPENVLISKNGMFTVALQTLGKKSLLNVPLFHMIQKHQLMQKKRPYLPNMRFFFDDEKLVGIHAPASAKTMEKTQSESVFALWASNWRGRATRASRLAG